MSIPPIRRRHEHEHELLTAAAAAAAADTYEREEHAQSIREIPPEQLLDEEARAELVRRALAGEEVYAYRPAFAPEYVVWHFRGNPAEECRWPPAEWARAWRAGEVHS